MLDKRQIQKENKKEITEAELSSLASINNETFIFTILDGWT